MYKEANFPGFAFLSTLSLRRATSALYWFSIADRYFYPRSPCGERPICQALIPPCNAFLSTLSLRRATLRRSASIWLDRYFYPRSPCGERLIMEATKIENKYFYPRSPCGERPIFAVRPYDAPIFLSTLSLRRATLFLRCGPMTRRYFYPRSPCGERHTPYALESWPDSISIHALLAESDGGPGG